MKFILGTYFLLLLGHPSSIVAAGNTTKQRGSNQESNKKNASRNKTLPGPDDQMATTSTNNKRRLKKDKCKTPTCGTGNYRDCPDDQGVFAYIGVCSCAELDDKTGDAVACANLGRDSVDASGQPDTGLGYIGDNSCFGNCENNGSGGTY